jgi:mannose-1-phosphate guanylyltransferase
MTDTSFFLVIIAGGSGTRFWPKSTSKKPKQLLSFGQSLGNSEATESSLLAQTLSRFEGWISKQQTLIVTTQTLETAISSAAPGVTVLSEPQARNTAPCIYWAARYVAAINPNAVMMVMPADHFIADVPAFLDVVKTAAKWSLENDHLVTLGVQPTRPETGYGYLKTSHYPHTLGIQHLSGQLQRVDAFVEKPNRAQAEQFIRSGNYLWNGGMFLWRASVILAAFDLYMPEMRRSWEESRGKIELAYPSMTATSIDYGIMEKAKNVVTFPLNCGWDDLGSWTSLDQLAEVLGARQNSNVVTSGNLIAIDSHGNIIDAPQRLVTLLGIENLIIVESGEALLIAQKSRAQDIRQIVEQVKNRRPDLV